MKALRAASREGDGKWVTAQQGNEPAAETMPFLRATEAAKRELEEAEERAAEQKKADETARAPSYASMYKRAEGNGSGALPKTAPEFRLRGELLEKRDRAEELEAEPTTAAVEATTAFWPAGASPTKTPATGARLSGRSTDGPDGLAST